MSQKKSGKIVVFCAPSGGGKSTLLKKLREDFPDLKESISCTTREKRGKEVDKEDYYFLGVEEFEKRINDGDFLEWAKVHQNYYGTSKRFVEEMLMNGHNILFDIDVQGADAIKEHYADISLIIFITPPSMEILEERLRKRQTDSDEAIKVRLECAEKELLRKNDYDLCLINDNLETCYSQLKKAVSDFFEG